MARPRDSIRYRLDFMVRRIQALNYRCLRHVDVRLEGNFHILVGPNASGKSTLLDVIGFFADMTPGSIESAVRNRVPDFRDLVWGRQGNDQRFELAIELDAGDPSAESARDAIRYELAVRGDEAGPRLETVQGLVVTDSVSVRRPVSRFPEPLSPVPSLLGTGQDACARVLFRGAKRFSDYIDDVRSRLDSIERSTDGDVKDLHQELDAAMAALKFDMLGLKVRKLILDGRRLREASPPAHTGAGLSPDGSNLPWIVRHLVEKHETRFQEWLDHVRIVLPELKGIRVVEREDDHRAYLMLSYGAGIEVPSWSVSEGTLRLLVLTVIAYLPDTGQIYLIEEPENGIHPLAIEAVYQSLLSVYGSHVFATTHSPTLLGCASPREVLCFAADPEGATDVISGADHPRLGEWRRAADMDLLFAPDVLG